MALLLLAANYSVHFFFGVRFRSVHAAILMNLSTYFLCYYLFSSALITLLNRFYITRKRIWTHIILWIIFSGLSGIVLFLFPDGIVQKSILLALAAWLVVYGLVCLADSLSHTAELSGFSMTRMPMIWVRI